MNKTRDTHPRPALLPQRRDPSLLQRGEPQRKASTAQHIYLRVGDKVVHKRFRSWGCGIVIESLASAVPGGLCYVRIQFQDGKKRVFDNSLDSSCCCYYAGVTLLNRIELE